MYKRLICVMLALLTLGSITVSAKSINSYSYRGYQYNSDNISTAAPVGFVAENMVSGADMMLEIAVDNNAPVSFDEGNVEQTKFFFIDTNRIVSTDADLNVLALYDDFTDENGNSVDISGAYSVAGDFENGNLYIAAPQKGKVLIFDMTGLYKGEISAVTNPIKVLYARGQLYILDLSSSNGYYLAAPDGSNLTYNSTGYTVSDFCYDAISDSVYVYGINGTIHNITADTELQSQAAIGGEKIAYSAAEDIYYIAFNDRVISIGADGALIDTMPIDGKIDGMTFSGEREQLIIKTDDGLKLKFYKEINKLTVEKSQLAFSLKAPSDILYDNNDTVYILDSGNGRVLSLDTKLESVKDICSHFITADGEFLDITEAMGLYVKDNLLYIADTTHYRVVISDMNGRVVKQIFKPEQLEETVEVPFRATKVILDSENNMYVISDSINMGALVFDSNGKYKSFFGSNDVTVTADVISNYIKKKFLTKEQTKALKKYTPISLANFDMDSKGFLYTVTSTDQIKVQNDFSKMLRKLNYSGNNVFNTDYGELSFGDVEWDRQQTITNTSFSDVDIDENGFIFTLDASRGKVFQYSDDGQFLSVFAGIGNQMGLFSNPTAIETIDGMVYVLDATLGNVTVFSQTEYGALVQKATLSLKSNRPDESIELWNQVLRLNTNNEYAYYGLGIAYEAKGDYKSAMENFRAAQARNEYSKAFREYRKTYARENIWWILLVIIAIAVAVTLLFRRIKSRMVAVHGTAYSPLETKGGLPVYVLFHPIDGFSQFRLRNLQSIPISIGIVVAFFLLRVFEFFCTGFAFNTNKAVNYSLLSSLAVTVLLFVLFVVSTWAINTFLDGKGKLKEIIAVTAYSITPYLSAVFINVLLSNVLTIQESAFLSIVSTIGFVWSALVLLMGMYTIQEYSFTKTVVSVMLSVLGMIIITLVIMLFFSLMQQSVSFIYSIFYEVKLR